MERPCWFCDRRTELRRWFPAPEKPAMEGVYGMVLPVCVVCQVTREKAGRPVSEIHVEQ